MSGDRPFLALVRDELVELDRDNAVDLLHQRALRDLVELLRDQESAIIARPPGQPLPAQNALVLRAWLVGSGFALPRTGDLRVLLDLAVAGRDPLTNEQADALQRVYAALESPAAAS